MTHAVTTSIRLSPELKGQLEHASQQLHRGKNWIITQALEEFLTKLDKSLLTKEARRQSLLASQTQTSEQQDWEQNTDTSGWE